MSLKPRVNWHEAASCAFQIELKDYSGILEYMTEYPLGKNSYRIDLLIIKKLTDEIIPKNIGRIFKTFNLLEIKGTGSSLNTDSYYKTIGYAGLLIAHMGKRSQYSGLDISLTFLSFHYPDRLMNHLKKERKLTVEKTCAGVYYVNKETFPIQIIVTKELSPKDNLHLRCLTNKLQDPGLAKQLTEDYNKHQNQKIYTRYMHQIITANHKKEGGNAMVSEGLLSLCNIITEDIVERTKKEAAEHYLPQIDYLKSLLTENGIPFDLESCHNNC